MVKTGFHIVFIVCRKMYKTGGGIDRCGIGEMALGVLVVPDQILEVFDIPVVGVVYYECVWLIWVS